MSIKTNEISNILHTHTHTHTGIILNNKESKIIKDKNIES